ncbi:cobyric acid synthase [Lentilactobacillus sp. IMAU92037]|uniref:cobyric acid synthase n=1 Tax=Lentilactobacillus TaxID=2767893 RepID=UPI001C2BC0B8|nr:MULTISPECIES: cobyric acid synthase [Lentilactobacillus]MBV0930404.1 cobyric acid synthase [Lentilactobacillus dabitei]MDM7515977.1 cobyric acid synthase [Lentilactobacillus sp. TOM.63]
MSAERIMFVGTTSDSGKSWAVTALCRILKQRGKKVAPFKSQNMALNSFITADGKEMGRAQVFQAEAAGVAPDVRMNPILLKPSTDSDAQIVFMGKVIGNMGAAEYQNYKPKLRTKVIDIFNSLAAENDVVVLEGAGSPTEINLSDNDIVNMGMAKMADAPVILVADIDRGGVYATIYGTIKLLPKEDQKRIKGIIINKFRGDESLLVSGNQMIEKLTGVPVIGVLPMTDIDLDDEDSVSLQSKRQTRDTTKDIDIAVITLSKISNFTDFHSLEIQPDVSVRYVRHADQVGTPDVLIIPGSKNTNEDMVFLREKHLDMAIKEAAENGSQIVGICGGYQLLGNQLRDPESVESDLKSQTGLGLLDTDTVFNEVKTTTQAEAKHSGQLLTGYEIHMGTTTLGPQMRPFSRIISNNGKPTHRDDGAVNQDGSVFGTYLHGLFDNIDWTRQFLNSVREKKGLKPLGKAVERQFNTYKENQYDRLANVFKEHVDMNRIDEILAASENHE